MKVITPLFPLPLLLILVSCGDGGNHGISIEIDNPSDQALELMVDSEYKIAVHPNDNIHTEIAPGEHTIQVSGQEESQKINLVQGISYLLNPTNANYVVEGVSYGNPDYGNVISQMMGKVPYDTIDILGIQIWGNYKKIAGDFIVSRDWDYGLDEEAPNEVTLDEGSMGTMLAKIHRETDFVAALLEQAALSTPEEDSVSTEVIEEVMEGDNY